MWYIVLAILMFVAGVAAYKHRVKIKAAAAAEANNLKNSAANEVKKL